MKVLNNLIINGFDRCGSSAITRLLAVHPQIELIFHPFNSGSIRRKMYQVMTDKIASDDDVRFFSSLEYGQFKHDYVVSPWFEKHSTTLDFLPDRLHVLKTTLNHLTIKWIQDNFPRIEFWGIWRDPFDILASLVRNKFFSKWYLDALPQLTETIMNNDEFPSFFMGYLKEINRSEVQTLSFLIAARSYFFFKFLKPEKLVNYEIFKIDPNAELNKVTKYFGLEKYSFQEQSEVDYNVVGSSFQKGKSYRYLIQEEDALFAQKIFSPLFTLMNERFGENTWLNCNNHDQGVQK